jgi:hypothetical protein
MTEKTDELNQNEKIKLFQEGKVEKKEFLNILKEYPKIEFNPLAIEKLVQCKKILKNNIKLLIKFWKKKTGIIILLKIIQKYINSWRNH